jgi:hypothetical protein
MSLAVIFTHTVRILDCFFNTNFSSTGDGYSPVLPVSLTPMVKFLKKFKLNLA